MDNNNPNNLPELDLNALEAEIQKEVKYGDKPLSAAGLGAARGITFGLSDAALVNSGLYTPEELNEINQRNAEASVVGEAAGIVGPALLSGGTSLAAKGASAGARGLTAAGTAAERAAVAGLKKIAPTVGEKTALIAGQTARGAAEGALVGAGQAVSDAALQNKDLTSESILAGAGAGALFGAGFGTVFGAAQATLPTAGAKSKSLVSKLKNVGKQAIDPLTDPAEASLRTIAGTAADRGKVRDRLGNYIADLPDYLKTDLQLDALTTTADLAQRNTANLRKVGEEISAVVSKIDDTILQQGTSISRPQVYQKILDKVDNTIETLAKNPEINRKEIAIAARYRNNIIRKGSDAAEFSFKELDDFRKTLAKKKFKGGGALESFEANLAGDLSRTAREMLNETADIASQAQPELAAALKSANKKFTIGSTISDSLEKAAERQPNITTPWDFAIGTAGRTARNTAVIYDLAERTAKAQQAITSSVDNFFNRIKPAKLPTGGIQALINTGFAINPDTQKAPKTRSEAFDNVSKNVQQLSSDSGLLVELLAKRTARIGAADPAVAQAMQEKLVSAINLLNAKLPRPAVNPGLFAKDYKPSSMELAKFERYVQVVENPLSALEELQRGTLTREHVEALQAVYPEIYRQIQQAAVQKIATTPQLAYAKKVQLGILLNIPADSSLDPQSVLMLQMGISGAASQSQGYESQGSDYREAGVDSMDIAGRAETGAQALESRE